MRIAVVGCGYWGQNLVRNFYQLGVLETICDPSEKSLENARKLAPTAATCDSYSTVLRDPSIDAVVIATPAETHFPLVKEALEHGKDVLVEKPLAIKYDQGAQLVALSRSTGRILMVGHLLEYHPAVLKLRGLIQAGELGRINYIYSNRLNFGKIRTEENALWSFAPHDVAIILRIMDEDPIEVTCTGGNYVTPNLADVTVSGLHFRTGVRAHIFVSWLNPFKEQKLVIVGEKKMAVFNDVSKDEKLVMYDQRVDMNERMPFLQKGPNQVIELSNDEPLRRECEQFLTAVETRQPPLTDGQSGLRVLRVLEACQISLQLNGRPILLADLREHA